MASNSERVLDRLAGLETEYAIRFQSARPTEAPRSKFHLYQRLLRILRLSVLTVTAKHFKDGVFMATGGAVWFESERPSSGAGLVEGSTPECRGARQLLAYQRAQDQLLGEAARAALFPDKMCLIKNDRDSCGNVYGAQENYEATLATGFRLFLWRAGLICLLPIMVLTWLGLIAMIVATLIYYATAGIVYFLTPQHWRASGKFARNLFGEDWHDGQSTGHPAPKWLENLMLVGARAVTFPLAVSLFVLIKLTAFRAVRKQLLPFLVSRPILSGSGFVADDGSFHLSDKADAINCVDGFGGVVGDRPLFNFGHFFKALCVEVPFAPAEFFDLLTPRQRLQIGLGDSNMAEVAEYLRIGTTMLVLDVIEAGELPPLPALSKPIAALHAICADSTLLHQLPGQNGARTALEIQRFYWQACRDFLDRRHFLPPEAQDIMSRWDHCLTALEVAPAFLFGSLDWVTKKFLLDELGADAAWAARKKLDICYHELSPAGYFERLKAIGLAAEILTAAEIERATRSAPHNSPATTRGHYIREFAHGHEPVFANWKKVVIGHGRRMKTIRLANYGRQKS